MFQGSSGFPFCLVRNLVQCLFTSLWIVLWCKVVICGCADNGSVRHGFLCVFFRKYMCGVNVLDKGCGGITVQVYVGCRVFEVAKSYLCVSVPVLDDDCVAFVRFVYDDSMIDDKLFQGLSLYVGLYKP